MPLNLISAEYGAIGSPSVADVTEQVRGFTDAKQLRIKLDVKGDTFGGIDPAPGVKKSLKVVYQREEGGEQQEVTMGEGETLEILAAGQDYYWPVDGPMKILEARYGSPEDNSKTIDVTSDVRDRAIEGNGFKVAMDAARWPQDPAPGKVKALTVTYTEADGQEAKTVTIKEGEPVNIEVAAAAPPADAPPAEAPPAEAAPVEEAVKAEVTDAAQPTSSANVPAQKLEWKSVDGQLKVNGHAFALKGWNWFGLETPCRKPEGLDKTSARSILDFLAGQGFNAVRLPISVTLAHDLDSPSKSIEDADLQGLTNGQLLEKIVDMCADRGLLVVLDMHRLKEDVSASPLWYEEGVSSEDVMGAWDNVLNRLKAKWNLMAIDLKNEPHGAASWGDSNPSYDWNKAAEQMINHMLERHSEWKGLFFVQGVADCNNVDTDSRSGYASWSGGNLEGVSKHPIANMNDPNQNATRVVYAPHAFGPSIYQQDYFGRGDFPGCMWDVWTKHFANAKDETGRAVVLGEWGGWFNSEQDCTWHSCMVDFLSQKGLNSAFYSGGVLSDDWTSPVQPKLDLLARLQPNPNKIKGTAQGQVFLAGPEGEVEL